MALDMPRRRRSGSREGARAHLQAVRALEDGDDGIDAFYDSTGGDGDDGANAQPRPRVSLTRKLPFQYKGDVFSQRGSYADASLYMSRLSPTRTAPPTRLRRGGGSSYRLQGKLAPMQQASHQPSPYRQDAQGEPSGGASLGASASSASMSGSNGSDSTSNGNGSNSSGSSNSNAAKSSRKLQYALAVAAMAANPALHAKLLSDSAILASIVSFGRTKDAVMLGACVGTLVHLSRQAEGRLAILNHSALALLVGLSLTLNVPPPAHAHPNEQSPPSGNASILRDCLAALANLTIEDGLEAGFIKEKGLECLLRHRKRSAFVEDACSMTVFNLSSPAYSYPRVDDVIAAVIDMVARDRGYEIDAEQQTKARLSRALFNLSSVKTNHAKLAEPDAILALQLMISQKQSREVRQTALAALWHLAASSNACRRSIVRCCTSGGGGGGGSHCIAVVVDQLHCQDLVSAAESDDLLCVLSILDCLARDDVAQELMARSNVLDALAALAISLPSLSTAATQADGFQAVALRLLALVLSLPTNVGAITERVFHLLVAFRHHEADGSSGRSLAARVLSRSVLFALASVMSWSGDADARATAPKKEPPRAKASSLSAGNLGPGAGALVIAGGGGSVVIPPPALPQRSPSPPSTSVSVDDILDQPGRLESVYRHVSVSAFAPSSPEAYLQMVLLYNLSFRYSKVDVAALAFPRLLAIAEPNRPSDASVRSQLQRETLALIGGTIFNLCQEYEVHPMLATAEGLSLLRILMEAAEASSASSDGNGNGDGESETQRLCLDTVCLLFDGRTVPRADLARVVRGLFPTLRGICSSHRAHHDAQVRAACGACLSRFATVGECRLFMIQHGVLASLRTLADTSVDDSRSSGECLRHCAATYSLLASAASDTNPSVGSALIDGGIVKALTLLADAPEEAVRRLCATVLCNLSTSEHAVVAMVKCGALRALLVISCVKSNDPETRRICMKAVLNLLRRQENVPQMCQEGLLWAFGLFFAAAGSAGSGGSTAMDGRLVHVAAGAATTAARDHEMLADAFCALSYYSQTRGGLIKKPAMVGSILKMLHASLPHDQPSLSTASVRKIISGLLNLLNEADSGDRSDSAAPMLLRLGVVPIALQLLDDLRSADHLDSSGADERDEMRALVAQILAIVFQTCAAEAEAEFARPEMLRGLLGVLEAAARSPQRRQMRDHCVKSCALLLFLMSRLERTRPVLVAPVASGGRAGIGAGELWHALPYFLRAVDDAGETGREKATASTRLLLLRCIYNLTCDASVMNRALAARLLPALGALLPSQSALQLTQSAAIVAGALRNLSTRADCLETLTNDAATTLLREAFASGAYSAKRDVALCTCNLFLGNINSHELLTRASLLPHVLWMCSSPADPPLISRTLSDSAASTDSSASASVAMAEASMAGIASAVLRKLATAPGNVAELLDSGVPTHLASLMRSSNSSVHVKINCMASFCLLAQHPEAPALLASAGVITLTLEALEREQSRVSESGEPASSHFEAICLELLSTLAAFASSEDPRECSIASTLFALMEKQDASGPNGSAPSPHNHAWRADRQFLSRDERGDLPPTRISAELRLPVSNVPVLRAVLQPFAYQGHSVAFSCPPSYVEMRTIEPLVPSADLLFACDEQEGCHLERHTPNSSRRRSQGGGDGYGGESADLQRRPSRKAAAGSTPPETLPEFKPPAMFGKLRNPLAPQSSPAFAGCSSSSGLDESSFEALALLAELNTRAPSRGTKSR